MNPPRRVLTIAGSDSGGGAGIQADLKTFAAHGVYGLSAVTAVTAQNSLEVRAVAPVPPAMVAAQIDAVLDDFGADAVKIGMLWSAETVRVVAARLRAYRRGTMPIVLDPVLAAGSGAALVADEAADAVAALLEELLPIATLITPNLPELAVLAGRLQVWERAAGAARQAAGAARQAAASAAAAAPAARAAAAAAAVPLPATMAARLELARRLAAHGPAVLAKGGHDPGPEDAEVVDLLLIGGAGRDGSGGGAGNPDGAGDRRGGARARRGERLVRFAAPRLRTRATHGTGCTLSAAIAARLATGEELAAAVGGAIGYVRRAMAAAPPRLGAGAGPLAHFHDLESPPPAAMGDPHPSTVLGACLDRS